MAPTRKSRGVNKRFSFVNEVSPSKDGENSKKSMQRKRKLSDLLGSQWSKEELQRFYEAYRKHGKDWKKVGAAVRNRSVEMVESLYMMNRAYLSLPEGTASVVGLIAMMTDHYCNLVGSDSEQESSDGGETSQKFQKRGKGSVRTKTTKRPEKKSLSHLETAASTSDCLSLLKKPSGETRPRAVGKRTPRFPVSASYEKNNGGMFLSPSRQGLKLKADADDDSVEHEVALALAQVSQRGGSSPVSQNSNQRIWREERMGTGLEMSSARHFSGMDEDGLEGSLGSRVGYKGEFASGRSLLMGTENAGNAVGKERSGYIKKSDIYGANNDLDDVKDARSKADGQNFGVKVGKISRHITRKKSKKTIFCRDEGSDFDALQTLADLSLMMPSTATEDESMVHVEEKEVNIGGKHGLLETDSVAQQRDRPNFFEVKTKANQAGYGASVAKTLKLGKDSSLDNSGIPEVKEQPQKSNSRLSRKKQQMFIAKIPRAEVHTVTNLSVTQEAEDRDVGKHGTSKGRCSPFSTSQQKQGKLNGCLGHSSPCTDLRGEKDETALTTAHLPVANQAVVPDKLRRRRKTDLQKPHHFKDINKCDMLSNCLSNSRVRRWCAFEWFYSAIDYPWFAKREFVEYLRHVGLGHVPRLTRVEWGVIRSSLGKPRRFSEQFLKEEKEKLDQYRDSVRKHYTELREGVREGLPTDLARPLSVSQRVMAIHPKTREVHDGNVLTVDHNQCRVQFDRPELGVEVVLDIDCMPLNPLENMPKSLARNAATMDKLYASFNELKMNVRANDQKLEGAMKLSSGERFEHVDVPSHLSPAYHLKNLMKQAKEITNDSNLQAKVGMNEAGNGQPVVNSALLAQMQAKEADVQALAELTRALEKKEAVVSELKHMNDDASENRRDGDSALKDSESFKKQYAAVIVQLNAVNDQVSRALQDLRQRNTYHSSIPAWPKTTSIVGDSDGPLISFNQQNHMQESVSLHEIVESSRRKARSLVDSAMQAISSLNIEENSLQRIEDTIGHISDQLSWDNSSVGDTRPFTPQNSIHGSLPLLTGPKLEQKIALDRIEAQIPSELISHCVATFLMIQKCSERQYPPAEVAQILESAVLSLHPCSPQNSSVYGEIQKCMGIIRNQILALIP